MEWISVKNELPKIGQCVIIHQMVYDKFNEWPITTYIFDLFDEKWKNGGLITHWMPLPHPPKDIDD